MPAKKTTAPPILSLPSWEEAFSDAVFVQALTEQYLPAYMRSTRWFGAKSSRIKQYQIEKYLPYRWEGQLWYLLLVEVVFMASNTETYFIPLAFCEGEDLPEASLIAQAEVDGKKGWLMDALFHEAFRNSLFYNILDQSEVPVEVGFVHFERGKKLDSLTEGSPLQSELLKLEQSNTTIVYNDQYFLKIYRKLFRDANPDYELSQFLSERSEFKNAPVFAGSLTWRRPGYYVVSLGLMQEKIPNQGDAWNWMLTQMQQYFRNIQEQEVTLEQLPKVELYAPCEIRDLPLVYIDLMGLNTLQKLYALGRTTAGMHIALFHDHIDRNFYPTTFGMDYVVWLQNRLIYQLDARYSLLEQNYEQLEGLSKEFADAFRENKDRIMNMILSFDWTWLNSTRIRIHGDYHLGQVLINKDDFYILDFEGEPESTIRDRKVKQTPLKDVAGMCRSFHYAVFATVFAHNDKLKLDQDFLMEAGGRYYRAAVAVFLQAYIQTAMEAGLNIGYQKEIDYLLRYHIFEKAIYELGYELNARPDWVIIPLKGLMQILNND